jgi:hypothetical protein
MDNASSFRSLCKGPHWQKIRAHAYAIPTCDGDIHFLAGPLRSAFHRVESIHQKFGSAITTVAIHAFCQVCIFNDLPIRRKKKAKKMMNFGLMQPQIPVTSKSGHRDTGMNNT